MNPNKLLIFIIATLLTACGITVKSDPVKVEGNVTHTVVIDASQLAHFFTAYCESKPENDTEEEIDACVNTQIVLFWQAIMNATPPNAVATPSPSPSP